MYRLTLYYLIGLVGYAVILSFLGILSYNPYEMLISTGIAIVSCYVANFIFSKVFKAVTNIESVLITALILVLIFPTKFPLNAVAFVALSLLAMGSKYLLAVEKKHIFNPAAIAVLMFSMLSSEHAATWWVGTPYMFLPVLLGGLLLMRRVQRERLVLAFLATWAIIIVGATFLRSPNLGAIYSAIMNGLSRSAILFFAFVMLTEPLTSPTTKRKQGLYSFFVALLYSTPQLRLFSIILTPEWALVLGNVLSQIISPQYRFVLRLTRKIQLSPDTYEFFFKRPKDLAYTAGQYLEWTLPHKKTDSRGNRRYFSISSSPTEDEISMLVKFYENPSSYKKRLISLDENEEIVTSSLSGEFILPKNQAVPMVFIAGGVGIAPFRSMIKYILDKQLKVDIILLFANRHEADIIYKDLLEKVLPLGIKTVDILTDTASLPEGWKGLTGHLDENKIKDAVPDYKRRLFYVSGPQLMVQSFEKILLNIGISKRNMKIDFFPGYTESK